MKFKAVIIITLLVLFFNCKRNDISRYNPTHEYQNVTDDRDALRPPEGYGTATTKSEPIQVVQHIDPNILKQQSTLSCPAVTGLTQVNFSTNTITLSWNNVGASQYGVYRETFPGSGVWDLAGTTRSTTFIMTGLAALGSYQVGVGSYFHNNPCPITNTIFASTGKDSIAPGQSNVVFLQFNPDTVRGTQWNVNGDIISCGSNVDDTSRAWILNWVRNCYAGHGRIEFTLQKSTYLAADPAYRQEIIFTTNDTFYCGTTPCAGGVSFTGSFHNNTPNWVFTRALNYNNRNIGQAGGHELGHALNIRYHAIDTCGQTYAPSQTLCADGIYRSKIMGTGYSDYQHFFQRPIYTSPPLGIPILSTFSCPTNHPDEDATIEAYLK